MANEITILTFEQIKTQIEARLVSAGSIITNRDEGGAFDLLIRITSLMIADAYAILDDSIDQVFTSKATGTFLDEHGASVGLTRGVATKATKEFKLTRLITTGVLQVAIADIIKTPVLPERGSLRWFSILNPLTPGFAGEFAIGISEITVTFEADDAGTEFNNMEDLLGVSGQAVTMTIETGLSGVDTVKSTGEDLKPGTDNETDIDFSVRIIGRWAELARGATKLSYINFAKNSSERVFDANVEDVRINPTDVTIVLSGPPGSRSLSLNIGVNAESSDNFNPDYTTDGFKTKQAGTHDGAPNAAILTDTTASFIVSGVEIGDLIKNLTDGSQATITAVGATTITGVLSGGTEDDWDVSDAYEIDRAVGPTNPSLKLGNDIHDFIREKAPLTDFIFLKSVTEVAQNLDVDISVLDGFDLATVQTSVTTRLRALFVVEKTVLDVTILKVGEDLLFSSLCKIVANTSGVKNFTFNTPAAGVDISVDDDKVLGLGTITVGEI